MQIRKRYQLGIVSFICCVIFALIAAYTFDTYSGAICGALTIPAVATAGVFFLFGVNKTFCDGEGIDTKNLSSPINLKIKSWVLWVIAILVIGFYIFKPVKPIVKMYNTNISYVNQYEKVQQERKMFYDKMWKTYLTKYQICELNRETFIEVTSIIMQGRSDGQNVSWKFVHENLPISYEEFASFYSNLSTFVTSQRESYYKLEKQAMGIIQQQNSMLDSFPNNLYNKVLDIPKLKYNPGFTSERTEEVFEAQREEL